MECKIDLCKMCETIPKWLVLALLFEEDGKSANVIGLANSCLEVACITRFREEVDDQIPDDLREFLVWKTLPVDLSPDYSFKWTEVES